MDERAACAQLKRRFEAAGFQIRENQTFDEDGVRFDIDGFDAARRVGYEYVTEEAGDGWDVDGEVINALAERRKRGELHVLVVDEADAPDAASLDHAIDEFLKTLPAASAHAAPASPAAEPAPPAPEHPEPEPLAPEHPEPPEPAPPAPEHPEPAPPAPGQPEPEPPAPEHPTASEQAAASEPLDEPEEIAAPEPDEPEPAAPKPTPAGKTSKPPPTPKAAKATVPPPTPKAAKKKPARKPK